MISSFTFRLVDKGGDAQRIVFTPAGGESVDVLVPGIVFPDNGEQKFRQMYQVLVERGLIPDLKAVYNA